MQRRSDTPMALLKNLTESLTKSLERGRGAGRAAGNRLELFAILFPLCRVLLRVSGISPKVRQMPNINQIGVLS